MSVKLLTEHHLEFLSLKVGCTSSSESTIVKMSNCWKSHVAALVIVSELNTYFMVLIFKMHSRTTHLQNVFIWLFLCMKSLLYFH